jgi:hypothetical protein
MKRKITSLELNMRRKARRESNEVNKKFNAKGVHTTFKTMMYCGAVFTRNNEDDGC